jgi:hypothetical protein
MQVIDFGDFIRDLQKNLEQISELLLEASAQITELSGNGVVASQAPCVLDIPDHHS